MKRQWKLTLAGLLAVSPILAGNAARPAITLQVVNLSNASERSLLRAETVADWIMGKAGVRVAWLNCVFQDAACSSGFGPNEFSMRIVGAAATDRSGSALGWAVVDGVAEGGAYASVSYGRIEQLASSAMVEATDVLGAAMAHEVGHLLLGTKHSPTGVMSTAWGSQQFFSMGKGEFGFTAEQARRIRATIAARASAIATARPDGKS